MLGAADGLWACVRQSNKRGHEQRTRRSMNGIATQSIAPALTLVAFLCPLCSSVSSSGFGEQDGGAPNRLRVDDVSNDRIDRVEQWLRAVARHEAGVDDEAATTIASWPNGDLQLFW